jgi:hypothetical protein
MLVTPAGTVKLLLPGVEKVSVVTCPIAAPPHSITSPASAKQRKDRASEML